MDLTLIYKACKTSRGIFCIKLARAIWGTYSGLKMWSFTSTNPKQMNHAGWWAFRGSELTVGNVFNNTLQSFKGPSSAASVSRNPVKQNVFGGEGGALVLMKTTSRSLCFVCDSATQFTSKILNICQLMGRFYRLPTTKHCCAHFRLRL